MSVETVKLKPRSPGKVIAAATILGAAEGAFLAFPIAGIGSIPGAIIGAVTGASTAWSAEAFINGSPKQTLVVSGSSTVEIQGPETTQTLNSSASASKEDVPWIQKQSTLNALARQVRTKLASVSASQAEKDTHIQRKDMAIAIRVESPAIV